jgi:preprotein translocase subunit YajC
MDLFISSAYAQSAGATQPGLLQNLVLFVPFILIFYFLLIRPQSKRAKEHQNLVSQLAVGDEIVTNGGILGTITHLDEAYMSLEVAKDVRIRVQRHQVAQVLPKGSIKAA